MLIDELKSLRQIVIGLQKQDKDSNTELNSSQTTSIRLKSLAPDISDGHSEQQNKDNLNILQTMIRQHDAQIEMITQSKLTL